MCSVLVCWCGEQVLTTHLAPGVPVDQVLPMPQVRLQLMHTKTPPLFWLYSLDFSIKFDRSPFSCLIGATERQRDKQLYVLGNAGVVLYCVQPFLRRGTAPGGSAVDGVLDRVLGSWCWEG